MHPNTEKAFEVCFEPGWVDDKAQGGTGKNKCKEQLGVLSTGVKLECDKKGGVKKGMWTRLSSRAGVKNLKTDSFNSSGMISVVFT